MPKACPSACLPGARERAAERGANAGERSWAARRAGRIGSVEGLMVMRLASGRLRSAAGGIRGGEMAKIISSLLRLFPLSWTSAVLGFARAK